MKTKLLFLVVLAALVGVAIMLNRSANPVADGHGHAEEQHAEEQKPAPVEKPASLEPGSVVTVTTVRGKFKFVLFEKDLPVTTKNFIELANRKFYNGLKFHRVEDIVIQGGDPKGDGTGGSKKTIPLETKPGIGFDQVYMVGMARTNDPNSATSQFFVNKYAISEWTGQYSAFGRVFEGQSVVEAIKVGDVMKSVTVAKPTTADLAAIKKLKWSVE
jgi:cyclophilin family peptidyl-prolyl cis-trans isomerase